jgi:hypothetical protein
MCEPHNAHLNTRFENVKPLVRELLAANGHVVLDGSQALDLGVWMVKTWALLAHPKARYGAPGVTLTQWDTAPLSIWQWMATDAAPPPGLSVWVSHRGTRVTSRPRRVIDLPLVQADGAQFDFVERRWGFKFLDVSLVHHPGWEIDHPLERDGRAIRIWPRQPGQPADFRGLVPIDPEEFAWRKSLTIRFRPGCFPSEALPPLSEHFNPLGDPLCLSLMQGGSMGSR